MADVREPVAWVNSARMSGAFYMYVEGASDERFWNKFVDSSNVKLQVCFGCKKLLAVIDEHIKQGVNDFLAVIDRDFCGILGNTPKKDNLFITDDHDIEMTMYHKGNAFSEMLNAIDRGGKIGAYVKQGHDILDETMEITNDIGCCKVANEKGNLGIIFAHENEKTHEIKRPKYEGCMDGKTGKYNGLNHVVAKIKGFNDSIKNKTPKETSIIAAAQSEKTVGYDKWQLSNGHDVSYLLPYIIRRRCKHSNNNMDIEFIDSVLYAAYKVDDFHLTTLYKEMDIWSRKKKLKLFL